MRMPFADGMFDCVTCGWVIEHLPDPRPGLREIGRVLRPGGSALILATEDTVSGAFVSRTWKCRTYNRKELQRACDEVGLPWKAQLWFTPVHRFFKMGGILVEAIKPAEPQPVPAAVEGDSEPQCTGPSGGRATSANQKPSRRPILRPRSKSARGTWVRPSRRCGIRPARRRDRPVRAARPATRRRTARPTNRGSSCFGSTHVSTARKPAANISRASCGVSFCVVQMGKRGSIPVPANFFSR